MNKNTHPLLIHSANQNLLMIVINFCALWLLKIEGREDTIFVPLIHISICLCLAYGMLICIGWIVSIVTRQVYIVEVSEKKSSSNSKGKDHGSSSH